MERRKPTPWAVDFARRSGGEFKPRTKQEVVDAVQRINAESPLGLVLRGRRDLLYRALITLHPAADEKLALGCAGFAVRANSWRGSPSRGPHVVTPATAVEEGYVLPHGVTVPFSHTVCLGRAPHLPQPREAARAAVSDAIDRFRRDAFWGVESVPCAARRSPGCAGRVRIEEGEVDHAPPWPFVWIYEAWRRTLAAEPIARERYWFDADGVCNFVVEFADEALAVSFRSFHDERASLRIACKSCNYGKGMARGGEIARR